MDISSLGSSWGENGVVFREEALVRKLHLFLFLL